MAVGAALSRWEEIEDELVQIFKRTLRLNVELTYVIYGNLPSIKAKETMMMEVAEYVFRDKPEHIKYFRELLKLVGKVGERRNDIAHGLVRRDRGGGFLLYSPQSSKRGFNFDKWERKYAFTEEHVKHYIELFKSLECELLDASPLLFATYVFGSSSQTLLSRYLLPYKTVLQTMKTDPTPPRPPQSSPA